MLRKMIQRYFSGKSIDPRNILADAAKPVIESLEGRRLLSAGDLDTTFNPPNGYVSNDFGGFGGAGALTVYPTNISGSADKIVAVGSANFHIAIARYLPNGQLDPSFVGDGITTVQAGQPGLLGVTLGDDSAATAVAIDSAGKIVITGYVNQGLTSGDVFVMRLNDDGTPDLTFGLGGIRIDAALGSQMARDLVIDGGGNIYVAGDDVDADLGFVAKYDSLGLPDLGFGSIINPGYAKFDIGGGETMYSIARQADGMLVVGGVADGHAAVVRLLADGSDLDAGFGSGGAYLSLDHVFENMYDIALDSSENILITGEYIDTGVDSALFVRRLTNAGAIDSGFAGDGEQEIIGAGPDDLWTGFDVATDSSGRIVVTGTHQDSSFTTSVLLVRLSSTGAFDATFGTGGVVQTSPTGFDGAAGVAFQSDGKIIVTGADLTGFLTLRYLAENAVPPSPVFIDGFGNLVINGTTGNDTVSVVNAVGGVKVTLNATNYGVFAPTGRIIVSALDGDDNINISNSVTIGADIDGGIGNDTLNGGGGNDSILGGGDNDVINGRNGNDTLDGGSGADSILGGNGDDSILGDAGNDTLRGNNGNDYLDGGDDDDDIHGNADNDTSLGGSGNDVVANDAGNDLLYGGIGDDTLRAGGGADVVYGEDGNDSLAGGTGDDSLYGGADNDTINGGSGNDLIDGGSGSDDLNGQGGADIVVGGDGADIVQGGTERDILIGGDGSDSILGNAEEDVLIAGTTSHDGDSATLISAMGVWNGGGTYASRVSSLQSSYFTPDVTVFDDGDVDTLTGGAGTDLFIFNNDGIAIDVVDRKPASETGLDVD